MGLDVRDVRLVVQRQLPSSVEDYLQEFGRAGRDGQPSVAILFTSDRNDGLPRFMAERTIDAANPDPALRAELLEAKYRAIDRIIDMSTERGRCFRAAIADYFGSGGSARRVSLARRLTEWIFTRSSRTAQATACCDRCDKVDADNVVTWTTAVLSNKANKSDQR